MPGSTNTLASIGRRDRWMSQTQRKLGGTQIPARQPKVPEGSDKRNRPGWTEAVVATHSTAGQGASPARMRGELRPKGPTITTERTREGNAGHGVGAKETQEGLRARKLRQRNWHGLRKTPCAKSGTRWGSNSHVALRSHQLQG